MTAIITIWTQGSVGSTVQVLKGGESTGESKITVREEICRLHSMLSGEMQRQVNQEKTEMRDFQLTQMNGNKPTGKAMGLTFLININ